MTDVMLVCDGESGDMNLEALVADTFKELFELWKERQKKYGVGNIAAFGEIGCLIRGYDKMARIKNFADHSLRGDPLTPAGDETLEDSWKDLGNYAVMGLMCHRDQWPGVVK